MAKLEDVILFQIDKTSKRSKQYSQRIFDSLGIKITIDQWVLLVMISEQVELSQKELADMSNRDPASITRTLDILEKKGYLERQSIPGNRRKYNISLSKSGSAFVNQHMPLIKSMRQKSTNGFSEKELEILMTLLKRIQDNMT